MVNRFKNLSITIKIKATILLSLPAMFLLLVVSGVTHLFARHELQQSTEACQTATVTVASVVETRYVFYDPSAAESAKIRQYLALARSC